MNTARSIIFHRIMVHDTFSMPSKFQSKSSLRDKATGSGCLTLGSPDGKNGSSLKSGFPLKKPNVLAKRPTFQLSSARCITNLVPMLGSARARVIPNPDAAAGSPRGTEKLAPCSTQPRSTATAKTLQLYMLLSALHVPLLHVTAREGKNRKRA